MTRLYWIGPLDIYIEVEPLFQLPVFLFFSADSQWNQPILLAQSCLLSRFSAWDHWWWTSSQEKSSSWQKGGHHIHDGYGTWWVSSFNKPQCVRFSESMYYAFGCHRLLFPDHFRYTSSLNIAIMTSSNGNIFRVTGPVGNSPVTGEFPSQRPVMRSFDVFFDLRMNKRLSKQTIVRLVIWDAMVFIMTSQ